MSNGGAGEMSSKFITEYDIEIMSMHLRERRGGDRPVFVFPCGGDERYHPTRRLFREYVQRNASGTLKNVFCLTAEDIAQSNALREWNLLQQEAVLADICDCIIIFAESVGSYCELGAFSSLPHASRITSVVIPKKYKDDSSFLNDGPARELEGNESDLSRRFYLQFDSPFSDAEFTKYVSSLRKTITNSASKNYQNVRMKLNDDEANVAVGPLVHELMDLLQLLGPSTEEELLDTYCNVKQFRPTKLQIKSTILEKDIRESPKSKITMSSVVEMMMATGLAQRDEKGYLFPTVHLDSYFMFKSIYAPEFSRLHARVLLRKRKGGVIPHAYC